MKKKALVASFFFLTLLLAGSAWAVTATQTLDISADVTATAELTLGVASINFPATSPSSTMSIASNPATVNVTANALTGSSSIVNLTVRCNQDLTNAALNTITIDKVTWTATNTLSPGGAFVAGTMTLAAGGASAGQWTGSGNRTGTFSYFLANSWGYATGHYTAQATYTLDSP